MGQNQSENKNYKNKEHNINNYRYAPTIDVISAAEFLIENSIADKFIMGFSDVQDMISLINIGEINEGADIFINILEDNIIFSMLTSYLYSPNNLIANMASANKIDQREEIAMYSWNEKWNVINELLEGYIHTNAVPIISDDGEINTGLKFDTIFSGGINKSNKWLEAEGARFDLDIGTEYEEYERNLKGASSNLKQNGKLILLSKPGWILKSWELIEQLELQLEYQESSIYLNDLRHPNTYVWLKFVNAGKNFDSEKQKRNILSLMRDNNIDRLFAHRNDLKFPYVDLSYKNSETYVNLNQDLSCMQYFFSAETTKNLALLCEGCTACLVTPSVAAAHAEMCAQQKIANAAKHKVVLFERDNRFRQKDGVKFVKYDLNTGLTKLTQRQYAGKFDKVICDPPFDINLDILARDIKELLKIGQEAHVEAYAYVVFPEHRKVSLINAMNSKGFVLSQNKAYFDIEYGRPPKLVRVYGKQAIQLYKFEYRG